MIITEVGCAILTWCGEISRDVRAEIAQMDGMVRAAQALGR